MENGYQVDDVNDGYVQVIPAAATQPSEEDGQTERVYVKNVLPPATTFFGFLFRPYMVMMNAAVNLVLARKSFMVMMVVSFFLSSFVVMPLWNAFVNPAGLTMIALFTLAQGIIRYAMYKSTRRASRERMEQRMATVSQEVAKVDA